MTDLHFEILEGYAYAASAEENGISESRLIFSPKINGYLCVDERTYKISDGVCVIDAKRMDDGKHSFIIYRDSEAIKAEPFEKCGRRLQHTSVSDKYARECIRRIIALTERLSELEQKYSELDKAVNGTPLFKLP